MFDAIENDQYFIFSYSYSFDTIYINLNNILYIYLYSERKRERKRESIHREINFFCESFWLVNSRDLYYGGKFFITDIC